MKEFIRNHISLIISEETEKNLTKNLDYYKNLTQEYDFTFSYNNYPSYAKLCGVFNLIKGNVANIKKCNFFLNIENKCFTEKDIAVIKYFSKLLRHNNIDLDFRELNILWNDSEFDKTYDLLNKKCNNVQTLNLSPFEQFLCLYNESTNRVYNEEKENESWITSRSIVGINNSNNIVCAGYANWLKAMCTYLQNPNIKCISLPVDYFVKDVYKASHKVNMVYIKDEKYGIDGLYYADSCWDSKKTETSTMKLSHCLIPIRDMLFTKSFKLKAVPGDEFAYLFDDTKPTKDIVHKNCMALKGIEELGFCNINEQRKKFAQKVLKQAQEYSVEKSQEYLDNLKFCMETNQPFKKPMLEYSFLRHICNKIKANSKPIEYTKYIQALQVVTKQYLNMSEDEAAKYIDEVLALTKSKSFDEFSTGAQNSQYIQSKIEYDRRLEHMKQIKEHRKKLLEEKKQKLKQKKQEEQIKE